jgi:hypothetical protein
LQRAYRDTSTTEPRPKLRTPDALILASSLLYAGRETVIGGDERCTRVPGIQARIVLLEERG